MPHREAAADAERALLNAIHATGWCDDSISALASEGGMKIGRSTVARYRGGSRSIPAGLCALLLGQMPAEDAEAALAAYRRQIAAQPVSNTDATATARETVRAFLHAGATLSDRLADGRLDDDELRSLDLSGVESLISRLSTLKRRLRVVG